MEEKYLIATTRHRGVYPGTLLFWGRDRRGYTSDITHAGRYSEAEAKEITAGNGDTPIAESLVRVMPKMLVADIGELHNLNLRQAEATAYAVTHPRPHGNFHVIKDMGDFTDLTSAQVYDMLATAVPVEYACLVGGLQYFRVPGGQEVK